MFRLTFNEGFDGVWETWGLFETREDAEHALEHDEDIGRARDAWSWWIEQED